MNKYFEPYRLSALQRAVLIPYYSIGSILQPQNGEYVAGLGDVTGSLVLPQLVAKFQKTKTGQSLLEKKPLITESSLDVNKLRLLPRNTLGKKYVDYMDEHHFSADERSKVKYNYNPNHAYVLCRYRQVHDFWHTLSGLPPSILGELVLKVFEYEVTGLPVCLLSGSFGQLRLNRGEILQYYTVGLPWAIKTGKKCSNSFRSNNQFDVLTYLYEENLEKDIDEVRKELAFDPAPQL